MGSVELIPVSRKYLTLALGLAYDDAICPSFGQDLSSPDISARQLLNLLHRKRLWLAIRLIQTWLELNTRRGTWLWIQEFGHLTTWILQLRENNSPSRLGGFDCWGECSDGIPGVARVEDGVVVVLEVVSVDGDVAEADETCAAVCELYLCRLISIVRGLSFEKYGITLIELSILVFRLAGVVEAVLVIG